MARANGSTVPDLRAVTRRQLTLYVAVAGVLIAAAVAVCCEPVICWVSCLVTCCWLWPGPNSSTSGTTASCGVSQARSAVKTFSFCSGPPW
jgi:hypothetical protein